MKRLTPTYQDNLDDTYAFMVSYANGNYIHISDVVDFLKEHYNEDHVKIFTDSLE